MRLNPQKSLRQRSQRAPPTPGAHSQCPLLQPAVAIVAPDVGPSGSPPPEGNSGGEEVSQSPAETNKTVNVSFSSSAICGNVIDKSIFRKQSDTGSDIINIV